MNPLRYLKEKGIRHALHVIYRYKLHGWLCRCILPFVKGRPLKDAIVIESHNDFDSNGGALYDYLIREGYNRRYTIIWLLKNRRPAGKLPPNVRTFSLYRPGLRKAYAVCTAKYLTADNELVEKVRPEQVSLFCDHGGVSMKSVKGLYRLPDSVDYILSPSESYAPILASQYEVSYPSPRFLHVGYPQHDVFWEPSENELAKLTAHSYDKVFLWMPTFRVGGGAGRRDSLAEQPFGIPLVESEAMLQALQQFLEKANCLLLIKIHPMQDKATLTRLHGSDNIRILTAEAMKKLHINNYRLLKNVDALISDYSSIAYCRAVRLHRPASACLADREQSIKD